MTDFWKNLTKNWADGVNFVLGLILFFAAWIFGYAGVSAALWNGLIVGAVIVILSVAAIMAWKDWEEWLGMLLGAWLVISPWALGFVSFARAEPTGFAATVTTLVIGIAVFVLAAYSIYSHRETGARAH